MGAVIGATALLLGWGIAHADEDATPGGVPGQAEPVAPATGQGDINIEVKPGPTGTTTTTTAAPGTTTTVKPGAAGTTTTVQPGPGGTTTTRTTTTTGETTVEVQPAPGQPPANVDVNVTPPPAAVAPVTTPGTTGVAPTAGGDRLAPEAQTPALNNGVTEQSLPVPVQPIPDPYARPYDARSGWSSRIGAGVLVGGGVEDFTNGGMQAMTSTGGTWNARIVAGTRQYVGVEAAYAGAARNIDALGLSNNAVLLSNGVEGAVRLNIPIMARATLLEPFGFAGLGYSRYSLTNTNVNTSSVAGGDDIMTVPFGGGFAVGYRSFIADARFTYRQTYYNDLLRASSGSNNLNTWGVSGQIGFGF